MLAFIVLSTAACALTLSAIVRGRAHIYVNLFFTMVGAEIVCVGGSPIFVPAMNLSGDLVKKHMQKIKRYV